MSASKLAPQREEEIRREFEGDEMMSADFHLTGAIRAIKEGWILLEGRLSKSKRICPHRPVQMSPIFLGI